MKNHKFLHLLFTEETGVLAFEWILLAVILSVGIIGGMVVFRDTAVLKFGDVSNAAVHLDQSCSGSCLTHDYVDSPGTVTAE
ncbi:MAG: DUF2897 family protein [Thermoguttaceae bacterium]|nr:DUF2897 family protein [Thermoguttaceae bacterium]